MLLGEVNTALKDLARYFGDEDGDQLNMQFAFMLNQQLWLSLAREEAEPLESIIRSLPEVPPENAWATFLRNHDELSLDKLTGPQREEVFAAFGPDSGMQLYGHGLRRRTAAMLGGDGPRLRMAWSLMLSLAGTPVIFMGDEIGMGENLAIPDRMSVRVPMQWSDGRNGGFSSARKADLVRPMATGKLGFKHVNVAAQRRDPDSLLNWMERLIRRRKETPEFGWGTSSLIETAAPELFAHRCEWQGSTVIAVHNLSGKPAKATLELGGGGKKAVVNDLLEDRDHAVKSDGTLDVALDGYGYLWLRVLAARPAPADLARRFSARAPRRHAARARPRPIASPAARSMWVESSTRGGPDPARTRRPGLRGEVQQGQDSCPVVLALVGEHVGAGLDPALLALLQGGLIAPQAQQRAVQREHRARIGRLGRRVQPLRVGSDRQPRHAGGETRARPGG